MKSHTAHIFDLAHQLPVRITTWQIRIPAMVISVRHVLAVLSAVALVAALVILSVGISEMDMGTYVAGAGWGVALIFLALALDNDTGKAALQVLTALALVVLAWLQFSIATEWVIVSAALVSPWLASGTYRLLQRNG